MFATGFGLGLCPVASGTAGTLPGILLVALIWPLGLAWQIGLSVLLAAAAVPICEVAERHYGVKDDRRIVADEYLTFPLCMIGLPASVPVFALAFFTSRLLDVIKPPPAAQAQRLPGGVGIVVDDVMSNVYALALNHLLWRILGQMAG